MRDQFLFASDFFASKPVDYGNVVGKHIPCDFVIYCPSHLPICVNFLQMVFFLMAICALKVPCHCSINCEYFIDFYEFFS